MEVNQETSEVTNSTNYELKNGENEGERVNPTIPKETDVSESSSNAIVTTAVSATVFAKEGYANGASSSSSRVRAPPPLLFKVYDIVNNPETDSIISWSSSGTSFIVRENTSGTTALRASVANSTHMFRKINWDRLKFQNAWFIKGKKSWLKKIKRKIQGT